MYIYIMTCRSASDVDCFGNQNLNFHHCFDPMICILTGADFGHFIVLDFVVWDQQFLLSTWTQSLPSTCWIIGRSPLSWFRRKWAQKRPKDKFIVTLHRGEGNNVIVSSLHSWRTCFLKNTQKKHTPNAGIFTPQQVWGTGRWFCSAELLFKRKWTQAASFFLLFLLLLLIIIIYRESFQNWGYYNYSEEGRKDACSTCLFEMEERSLNCWSSTLNTLLCIF